MARKAVRPYGQPQDAPKKTDPVIDKPTTEYPSADEVTKFHRNADTDARAEAIHHTLGRGDHQAASGAHKHDGTDSALLLEGVILTGSKTASPPTAALTSIVSALVKLGATDSTT